MAHPPHASPTGGAPGHETRDVRLGPIIWSALAFFLLTALAFVVALPTLHLFVDEAARSSPPPNPLVAAGARQVPPEPRLQANPLADLRALRATEEETLTTYAWVDKNAGIVRIPIERAMQLLVERGVPARTEGSH
jgi:hypothetical protein